MRRPNVLHIATAMAGVTFESRLRLEGEITATVTGVTLMLRGPSVIDIPGVQDDRDWVFTQPPTATESWVAGKYWFSVRAVSPTESREICSGEVCIAADFANATAGYNGSTPNEIALAAIVAVIANRATQDQQRYTIGDRELWRTPITDLLKLKSSYTVAVRRERKKAAGNTSFGRKIPVRF
jgi:hypothetical protein